MSSGLLLGWAAFGVFLGVFTLLVAERERKRGASRWSWMLLGAFGIVLLCLSFLRLIVMVSS
jgi:cytochrome b561